MKVAFVNQAIDTIIPPGQNSVGACTYGVANILAKSCDVVVYGAKSSNQAHGTEVSALGVKYWLRAHRLFPLPACSTRPLPGKSPWTCSARPAM
jgi:hypothetical protein